MTARRARAVKVRRGQIRCYAVYARRASEEWQRERPDKWAPLGESFVVLRYPWLKGWAPVAAFNGFVASFFNVMTVPRIAQLKPYEGEPVTFPLGG